MKIHDSGVFSFFITDILIITSFFFTLDDLLKKRFYWHLWFHEEFLLHNRLYIVKKRVYSL